uniref:Zf-CCHC domain-containing protein/UBN2 domain-containing protein n=1 Tax=Tanacetum cinerariifolium TaxID=118510 RepID=A0A6L2NID2_TANCI|nr:zf-CCHC domain-containing protein/UBN2 domain-containing protein [Tanacetum cinerariifolium]
MCKTAKDIRKSLLITHQGNSQVKDNKIDLLIQQYEQFTILEEESINNGFARFSTIITSLKALDECLSGKNYVRKFLRALHPKLRAKVMTSEESKDSSSLALDELIGNLKGHDVVMEKDYEIYKGKKERVKSISLKTKKDSSDDETSTSKSDDEEYAMVIKNFKKFFRRKVKFDRQPREEKSHSDKVMRRNERVIGNALDVVIQIISLVIFQSLHATKIKRPLLEVLKAIAKMNPRTKPTMKLFSWLNHQMSQMHNNIMAAGSRDRPPILAQGRYPQWRSRFLRYVDTRPNGKALRKCILSGPYKTTTILVQATEATDNSLAVPEHTIVKTPTNMSLENKAHFLAEKEAIHLILTGIGDDIYSTVDACQTAQEIKPKRVKDSAFLKEKMLLCKQAEQGVPLQAEQYDWLGDTDEEVDEQELEAHYSYIAKI